MNCRYNVHHSIRLGSDELTSGSSRSLRRRLGVDHVIRFIYIFTYPSFLSVTKSLKYTTDCPTFFRNISPLCYSNLGNTLLINATYKVSFLTPWSNLPQKSIDLLISFMAKIHKASAATAFHLWWSDVFILIWFTEKTVFDWQMWF